MAWYEVSTAPLTEAGEQIQSFANDLDAAQEKLYRIFSELPENLRALKQQRHITGGMKDLCVYAGSIARTLFGITEIYTNAERSALGGGDYAEDKQAKQTSKAAKPPQIIQKTNGVLLFGDLIMPDWLQAAVIKYEQSH